MDYKCISENLRAGRHAVPYYVIVVQQCMRCWHCHHTHAHTDWHKGAPWHDMIGLWLRELTSVTSGPSGELVISSAPTSSNPGADTSGSPYPFLSHCSRVWTGNTLPNTIVSLVPTAFQPQSMTLGLVQRLHHYGSHIVMDRFLRVAWPWPN